MGRPASAGAQWRAEAGVKEGWGTCQGHRQDISAHFPSPETSGGNFFQALGFLIPGESEWAVGCADWVRVVV